MEKNLCFNKLDICSQKTAIDEMRINTMYLSTVLDRIAYDVEDSLTNDYAGLWATLRVRISATAEWVGDNYETPRMFAALSVDTCDEDYLQDITRNILAPRVGFEFDERDVQRVCMAYSNGLAVAKIEVSDGRISPKHVAVMEKVLYDYICEMGNKADEEIVPIRAKWYYSDNGIVEYLREIDDSFTVDGHLAW
jgi:hypothetical protein